MGRKGRKPSKQTRNSTDDIDDEYGLNEVDEFASKKEKVLLSKSTLADQDAEEYDSHEDEEVLAIDDEEEEEDEEDEEEDEMDGEEAYRKVFGRRLDDDNQEKIDKEEGTMLDNDAAWGTTKNEYYGADDLEDDEVAKEIEQEALRQRKKHLEELNINDYMDESLENEWVKSAKEFDMSEFNQSTHHLDKKKTSIKDILNMSSESQKKYLQTLFPEFLPLCKEFAKLSNAKEALENRKEKSETTPLKIMALSSYLGTLSSYFSILLHELNTNEDFATMKDHPIMESILTLKELWRQASELPDGIVQPDLQPQGLNEDGKNTEVTEVENIVEDGTSESDSSKTSDKEEEDDEDESEVDLDDFEEYVKHSRTSKNSSKQAGVSAEEAIEDRDDYMEEEMADIDAQEKKARKKTLRFYTSKIDQEENKKIDRFKGDDDVPYKERLYERQQRLIEEARKRGLQGGSKDSELDNADYGIDDKAVSQSINEEGEKDYFNQILMKKQIKKHARQQAHKDAVKAAKEGKLAELAEDVGEEGKRAINYQILKNKGLTPNRKKENRNARVKKRKKYDKAQKKLKSVRAVYAGGLSGPYEGEKTGIKKNLTKSVKFSN